MGEVTRLYPAQQSRLSSFLKKGTRRVPAGPRVLEKLAPGQSTRRPASCSTEERFFGPLFPLSKLSGPKLSRLRAARFASSVIATTTPIRPKRIASVSIPRSMVNGCDSAFKHGSKPEDYHLTRTGWQNCAAASAAHFGQPPKPRGQRPVFYGPMPASGRGYVKTRRCF